jgi:hypothetical protein
MNGAGGTVELRVTKAEDSSVSSDEPVTMPVGCGRYADDRLVQAHGTGGTVELRVTIGEHTAVAADSPVPSSIGCRRQPHDRLGEMDT